MQIGFRQRELFSFQIVSNTQKKDSHLSCICCIDFIYHTFHGFSICNHTTHSTHRVSHQPFIGTQNSSNLRQQTHCISYIELHIIVKQINEIRGDIDIQMYVVEYTLIVSTKFKTLLAAIVTVCHDG